MKICGGRTELDQLAEIHEGGEVGDARGLLHVVGDDHDRVVVLQLVDQLLDLGGRDRIERRARLVEQDHLRLHRDGARDAQPLLLAAGQAQAVGAELVLDLVPQRGAAQRRLDAAVELGLRQPLVEPDAEGDVLVDRHRKRRRLLEHHADAGAQQIEVLLRRQHVLAVEQHLALGALVRIEVVHAVEDAQQRRLAAARRADEGRHLVLRRAAGDVLQRSAVAVIEIEVADRDLLRETAGRHRRAWSDARAHCNDATFMTFSRCGERPRDDAEREHGEGDDQRAGPGQLLPILVGRERELEDDDRQARHRRVEVGAPELVVERGEQQRRGFAGDAGDRQQDAGDHAGACAAR